MFAQEPSAWATNVRFDGLVMQRHGHGVLVIVCGLIGDAVRVEIGVAIPAVMAQVTHRADLLPVLEDGDRRDLAEHPVIPGRRHPRNDQEKAQ